MFASGQSYKCTNIVQHRRLLAKQEEAKELVRKMLDEGVIEESNSPWSSPIVLVIKKDGSTLFCVDYRKLNDVTKNDSYSFLGHTVSANGIKTTGTKIRAIRD